MHVYIQKIVSVHRKDHEKAEFEVHEVYAVDVLISTGEGKVINDTFILSFSTCETMF